MQALTTVYVNFLLRVYRGFIINPFYFAVAVQLQRGCQFCSSRLADVWAPMCRTVQRTPETASVLTRRAAYHNHTAITVHCDRDLVSGGV
jgi:hypothetical protein